MGYIWKSLEKCFLEMYGVGGGGSGTIFFRKLAITGVSLGFLLPVLVRFQTHCTSPQPPLPGALLGGGDFRGGKFKKSCFEKVGTVGELYEGKIMKKWGRTSLLMGSYPEW